MVMKPDARLHFGEAALSSATELPNVIDLDRTTAGGLFAAVSVPEAAAGGTSVAVTLKGSADGSTYTDIGSVTVATADLDGTKTFSVGIPRENRSRYLKVALSKTGTFTAGKVDAYIDTYGTR